MSRAVAAIDCGTNAIRLLVAEVDTDGILHEDVRLMRIVRLGEGIDRTGEFAARGARADLRRDRRVRRGHQGT